MSFSRSGYTLPVFACAAAMAALRHLRQEHSGETICLNLIEPDQRAEIPLEQVAKISENQALAITISDPGDNLDITRHTPIWALVTLQKRKGSQQVFLEGGEGIGRQINQGGKAAIYGYAQTLFYANLQPLLSPEEQIQITLILPEGKRLAQRTSNAAFGVIEGLSLLGTTGISQPLTALSQLEQYRAELATKKSWDTVVFCVGENGLDLAQKLGINPQRLIKTANWLGSMLVEAAAQNIENILLFGYHGKLIKLAGGIFHTHHHLADGRLEILTAYCAQVGLPTPLLQQVLTSSTADDALNLLRGIDTQQGSHWVEQVYDAIASAIDLRSQAYIYTHTEQQVCIGSVLFDRNRKIVIKSSQGTTLLAKLCYDSLNI